MERTLKRGESGRIYRRVGEGRGGRIARTWKKVGWMNRRVEERDGRGGRIGRTWKRVGRMDRRVGEGREGWKDWKDLEQSGKDG